MWWNKYNNGEKKAAKSKYKAKKYNGYASKKEYQRSLYLKNLQEQGEITELQEQVTFTLIKKQVDENGKCLERAVKYIADFTYLDKNDKLHVEDVKGFKTPEYKIKKKMMLFFYNVRIEEV